MGAPVGDADGAGVDGATVVAIEGEMVGAPVVGESVEGL